MTPESLRTQRFCGSPQSLRFVFLRLVVQPRNFLPQVRKTPSQLSPATQLTPFPPGAPNEDPATAWPEHGLGHDSIHWLKDTPTTPPPALGRGASQENPGHCTELFQRSRELLRVGGPSNSIFSKVISKPFLHPDPVLGPM